MTPANSFFDWNGLRGLPDFSALADDGFKPAFDLAMAEHNREIAAIAENRDMPDFTNTIDALELAGLSLSRVSALFWNRAGAHTNDLIRALEREMAPLLSRHYSAIARNKALFARIDALWQARESSGLDLERMRVLERHWKGFVRSGALLDDAGQEQLAAINERLATLGAQFGQNILADESGWSLALDESDLAGIPDFLKSAMASAAREHGVSSGFAVTLSRSIIEPFLAFSERRDLRETAFNAWIARGEGKNDNRPLVSEILHLRNSKARLLGYENFAAYKLDDSMAKTPDAVNALLAPVWEKAVERAGEEEAALEGLAREAGDNHSIKPWDWRYYSERMRSSKFDFSESELKPYLQLDQIIAAAFDVAGRLFGLSFKPLNDIKAYHPDVRVFEVLNREGNLQGIFMGDYFARPSKRSGAWMSAFQGQHKLQGGRIPFIYNVMNFARGAEDEPALLSLDDARTLFHEFGHALHGMLTEVTWPSVAGTSVSRDFVELPSQLYEHWLTVPAILKKHARHYRTGQPMPKELVDKMLAARNFAAGFNTVEFTSSALVDMAYHSRPDAPTDPLGFEAETLKKLDMPDAIVMRHRTPHFLHVFSGDGYSAGYYSYMWSEVLDADAFQAFEETGDPFNPQMAEKLRLNIYAAGGSKDPEELYLSFRGKMPTADAMMAKRGLA